MIWEKEVGAALEAKEDGEIKALYKVSGKRRVISVLDVKSHEEPDKIIMADLLMAHYLEFEEILPVRQYENFAEDVKNRWK